MTLRLTFVLLTSASFAFAGCAVDEHEEHESEPTADDVDYARAGSIDCTRDSATGYIAGTPSAIELIRVDGKPAKLETGDAFWVMHQAAAADGVSLIVVSGFRTMSEQRYLYGCYVNCNCNNCNLAARPGYSNHQSGLALDLNTHDPGVLRWLQRNAARFGFRRTVASEPWHWELVGDAPSLGPCLGGGAPEVTIVEPRGGTLDDNTVTFRADANEAVHHVRWSADGWFLGVSEDRSDRFMVRYRLSQLGKRRVEAVAYDEEDRELARANVTIDLLNAVERRGSLSFVSPSDLGWYANGLDLETEASPEVARVEYLAGPYSIGSSLDGGAGFAARHVFNTLGYRALTAVGYDAGGEEIARDSLLVRVMPGDESGVGPSVRFFAKNGAQLTNGDPIHVAGSDSIVKVELTADGFTVGSAPRSSEGFAINRTFTNTGARRLLATGYDEAGNAVATHEVEVTIR